MSLSTAFAHRGIHQRVTYLIHAPTPMHHVSTHAFRRATRQHARNIGRPTCIAAPVAPTQPSTSPALPPSISTHAIVIGGSITGMITAQALSRVFDKVTILERDAVLPTSLDQHTKRGGVPQFRQPHIMLLKGLQVLENMWPGIKQEFIDAGANRINPGQDYKTLYNGVFVVRDKWEEQLECISASRALIETVIRSQLLQNPKVTVRPGSLVSGLTMEDEAITGVQLKDGTTLTSDLVVDAAGRASQSSTWLKELGYDTPEEVSIDANVVYNAVNVKPKHDMVNIATIGGMGNVTYDAFVEYASALPNPYIKEFLEQCEPVTPPTSYSATGNRLRKFEDLERLPDNLVFVGDSVIAFNPVYGQGMTGGAIAAETLLEMLQQRVSDDNGGGLSSGDAVRVAIKGLPKKYQAELAKRLSFAWSIATAKSLLVLGDKAIIKKPNLVEKVAGQYVDALFAASMFDKHLQKKLALAVQLVTPPTTLFEPDMLARTLLVGLRRRFLPQTVDGSTR